jgi:hypothetical protein
VICTYGARTSDPATTTTKDAGQGGVAGDIGASEVIKVYPNPTEGSFSVEIPGIYANPQITIIDLTGKIIEDRAVSENKGEPVQFNLSNVAKGIYIVKVSANGSNQYFKLTIR